MQKDSRLRKLSKINRLRKPTNYELIINGEIIDVSMPRKPNLNPKDRIGQIRDIAKQFNGPKNCMIYLMLLVDGWTIDDHKIRSPYWMIDSVEFKWGCVPEYLKCLKSTKDQVLQTYSIERYTDSVSATEYSMLENPA